MSLDGKDPGQFLFHLKLAGTTDDVVQGTLGQLLIQESCQGITDDPQDAWFELKDITIRIVTIVHTVYLGCERKNMQ